MPKAHKLSCSVIPQLKTTREQLKLISVISNKGILNDWMASRLVESTDFNVAAASSLDIVSFSLFIVSVPIIYINEITLPLTFYNGKS
jgi:hypothetical protein